MIGIKIFTVVGAGGTGSFLLEHIIRQIYQINSYSENMYVLVFDPDVVEKKNVGRQNFMFEDIGKYKCTALFDRFKKHMNDKDNIPNIKFIFINKEFSIHRFINVMIQIIRTAIDFSNTNPSMRISTHSWSNTITLSNEIFIDSSNIIYDNINRPLNTFKLSENHNNFSFLEILHNIITERNTSHFIIKNFLSILSNTQGLSHQIMNSDDESEIESQAKYQISKISDILCWNIYFFGCVDNLDARYSIAECCDYIRNKIPYVNGDILYIDGGNSVSSGQIKIYDNDFLKNIYLDFKDLEYKDDEESCTALPTQTRLMNSMVANLLYGVYDSIIKKESIPVSEMFCSKYINTSNLKLDF